MMFASLKMSCVDPSQLNESLPNVKREVKWKGRPFALKRMEHEVVGGPAGHNV